MISWLKKAAMVFLSVALEMKSIVVDGKSMICATTSANDALKGMKTSSWQR